MIRDDDAEIAKEDNLDQERQMLDRRSCEALLADLEKEFPGRKYPSIERRA